MPDDSTPTTAEELQTALALVLDAQQPEPWAENFFYPRVLGAGPVPLLVTWDANAAELVIIFDETLADNDPEPGNLTAILETTTPGETAQYVATVATVDENTLTLSMDQGDVVVARSSVTYTAETDPILTGEFENAVDPFQIAAPPSD